MASTQSSVNDLEQILYAKGYRIRTVNGREEWYKASNLPLAPELKSDISHEPVGENPGADNHAGFRHVRITSCRLRLCDERNLFDKYFVDALVTAGILYDDSPTWCKIEVVQRIVINKADECTVIEVTESDKNPGTADTPRSEPNWPGNNYPAHDHPMRTETSSR